MIKTDTPRQELFCQEYLKDFNGKKAAIRAGYKAKTAEAAASRLLRRGKVAERVKELVGKRAAKIGIDADAVLSELWLIARSDIAAAFDASGNLKPVHEIPEDARRAIAGIESLEEYEGRGEDRHAIGMTRKIKLWDKPRCLELLGKHLGLYLDKIEHSGKISIDSVRIIHEK